jgi:ADP-ribose pyrophosphatase YjhB (NUDIX family)
MAIPEFVLTLRAKIGHDPMPLNGGMAAVLDERGRVLLVRRSDNHKWTLVTGCLDPGEQPAVGMLREIEEETGVIAAVERLVLVNTNDHVSSAPNGDLIWWTILGFRCRYVSGEARVNDDESIDVRWADLGDLPELPPQQARALALARADEPAWFAAGKAGSE